MNLIWNHVDNALKLKSDLNRFYLNMAINSGHSIHLSKVWWGD